MMRDGAHRPLVVFDGDCGFCRRSALWLEARTGDRVAFAPYQDDPDPRVAREDAEQRVQLVEVDGRVRQGAEACCHALGHAPGKGWVPWLYRLVPGFAPLSEWLYALVARRRVGISRVVQLLSGQDPTPLTWGIARRTFLHLLGACFVAAFVSLWVQVEGLWGTDGILPLAQLSDWQPDGGVREVLEVPTLLWLGQGDLALHLSCGLGTAGALSLALGFAPRLALAVAWICYLSLMASPPGPVGSGAGINVFAGYQWDGLLLEAGFLALWLTPAGLWPQARWSRPPSGAFLLLLRLLLFRIVLFAGVGKLVDPTWAAGRAHEFHFWTQPLPSWMSYWAHHGWAALLDALEWIVPVAETLLALLLFAPRRVRICAALAIVALQLGWFLLGNRGVYHLVVLALCALTVDDQTLARLRIGQLAGAARAVPAAALQYTRGIAAVALAVLAVSVSVRFWTADPVAEPSGVQRWLLRYPIANCYTLTTTVAERRPELVIEGSDDGREWRSIELVHKPGDPFRRPPWLGPHLPRLDWAMSEVARAVRDGAPSPAWFDALLLRILEGRAAVRGLLGHDTFGGVPPRYVRVRVWDYRFSDLEERERRGMWWFRRTAGIDGDPLKLEEGRLAPADF